MTPEHIAAKLTVDATALLRKLASEGRQPFAMTVEAAQLQRLKLTESDEPADWDFITSLGRDVLAMLDKGVGG